MWDGKIRFFNGRTGTLPYGLLLNALTFLRKLDYKIELDRDIIEAAPENKEHLYEFAKSLDIRSKGETIIPRDYQLEAFAHGINEGRSLIISPTGSGKSLIIYMAIRWYLENHDDRVMIVVPTTSLVEQLKKILQIIPVMTLSLIQNTRFTRFIVVKKKILGVHEL